ncbi:MAG: hypothetical protein ACSLFM_09050 [Tepidiformaceae bacterium]
MADFTAKAPFEAVKADALHDQTLKPERPDAWKMDFRMYLGWPLLGLLFSFGFAALVIELRDAWGSHRDWVPPAGMVNSIPGALALAYLGWRKKWKEVMPGAILVLITVALVAVNNLVGEMANNPDTAQDVITISGAVTLGLAVVALVIGFIKAEFGDPTKAPAPEM